MEEEEQDIIEVDKSLVEGDIYTKNKKHLRSYSCAQSLAEKGEARLWEHGGKYYMLPGYGPNGISVFEVVPLVPGMPSIKYLDANLIYDWQDGWTKEVDERLAGIIEIAMEIEDYFGNEMGRGKYTGYLVKSGNRMFVCNGRKVKVVAKKHGNQIQDAFAWANPAQEEMKI